MENSISLLRTHERNGLKYFFVYEIRVEKSDFSVISFERYISRSKAELALKSVLSVVKDYVTGWVIEQIVWIS